MVLRASLVIAAEDAHAFAEPWQRARWLCHCELSFGCCAGQRRERVRCCICCSNPDIRLWVKEVTGWRQLGTKTEDLVMSLEDLEFTSGDMVMVEVKLPEKGSEKGASVDKKA
jgi:hypothetical protein